MLVNNEVGKRVAAGKNRVNFLLSQSHRESYAQHFNTSLKPIQLRNGNFTWEMGILLMIFVGWWGQGLTLHNKRQVIIFQWFVNPLKPSVTSLNFPLFFFFISCNPFFDTLSTSPLSIHHVFFSIGQFFLLWETAMCILIPTLLSIFIIVKTSGLNRELILAIFFPILQDLQYHTSSMIWSQQTMVPYHQVGLTIPH